MYIKLYFYSFVAFIGAAGDSKLVTGKASMMPSDMQQATTSAQSQVLQLYINYLYSY